MYGETNLFLPHRRFTPHVARIVVLISLLGLAALAAFVFLGWEVRTVGTPAADRHMLQRVVDGTRAWPLALPKAVSLIGSDPVVIAVALIVVAFSAWRRRWWQAIFLAVAVGGSALLSTWTKHIFARPRPTTFLRAPATGYSFPSGHTLNAACLALALGCLLWRSAVPRWCQIAGSLALAVYALCVGVSRIVLGVHYPTDVLGGFLLAIAWVTVLLAVSISVAPGSEGIEERSP